MIDLSITQQFLTLAVNDKGKLSTFDQNGAICLIAGGVIELAQKQQAGFAYIKP